MVGVYIGGWGGAGAGAALNGVRHLGLEGLRTTAGVEAGGCAGFGFEVGQRNGSGVRGRGGGLGGWGASGAGG